MVFEITSIRKPCLRSYKYKDFQPENGAKSDLGTSPKLRDNSTYLNPKSFQNGVPESSKNHETIWFQTVFPVSPMVFLLLPWFLKVSAGCQKDTQGAKVEASDLPNNRLRTPKLSIYVSKVTAISKTTIKLTSKSRTACAHFNGKPKKSKRPETNKHRKAAQLAHHNNNHHATLFPRTRATGGGRGP